jgi:1-acyl-sn-glycerol-3-phosphate acyltransferase
MTKLSLWIAIHIMGPILGILVCFLEALTIIRFRNFHRYPVWEEKVLIVSNHPSLVEPVILPLMGFPWMNFPWAFAPLRRRIKLSLKWFEEFKKEFFLAKKLVPISVSDKKNYYDKIYMELLRELNIPVKRDGSASERLATVRALTRVLNEGGRIILFPEGGRTFKTTEKIKSPGGNEIGVLKEGAALLALLTGARVVPVWVDGSDKFLPNNSKFPFPRIWHRITINIGHSFVLDRSGFPKSLKEARRAASQIIARILLETGDEIG